MKTQTNKLLTFIKQQPRWRLIGGGIVIVLLMFFVFGGKKSASNGLAFTARKGNLLITVLEGGSIESLESQEIRSEVKGGQGTKVLKIVEEGYLVTEDDVKTNKVLVELDNSDIKQRMTQQEIQYQSALASLTEAAQGYEIQRNQNVSNIKAAEQKAQFARMDMEKFLGDKASSEIIKVLRFDKLAALAAKIPSGEDSERLMRNAMETNDTLNVEEPEVEASNDNKDGTKPELRPVSNTIVPKAQAIPTIDFAKYATAEQLGDGSAMQQLRKLMDDLQNSQQQQGLSQTKLTGTKRLFDKGFATKTELDTDEISSQNNELRVKTAETAYNLFIKYEFPKQAQELVSKYEESLRGLEREKKEAISKLAQAQARLKGAESRYSIEATQRKELLDQMDKCTIKAQKPGLVIYGGGNSDNYYSSYEQVREGATVRERQPIITIPNMAQMSVRVKIHESYIQKVKKGLKATIQVDAFPNKKLNGEVTKVALLPDSQNRWVNPDLKVYQTTVSITGTHDWLKPGMSAKVEILVKELEDVIYIPLQAVTEIDGKHFCRIDGIKPQIREIEVGDFNDEFIEVKSGLKSGEEVLLRAPDAGKPGEKSDTKKSEKKPETPAAKPAKNAA